MQTEAHANPVYLGFGALVELNELFRLRSQYLPLGKIGGKPAWLNPKIIPTEKDLECKVCNKGMCFMMQVYATGNNDPSHSFHRTIFVFLCRNPKCSQPNDVSNMAVFRCALPRDNSFFSSEGPMDPDLDGDVPDPKYPKDAPNLCVVCGCYASKKCAKCGDSWYCCRDHQALDWSTSHKKRCSQPVDPVEQPTLTNPANLFLFKEMSIEMDQEYVPGDLFKDISDDEEDGENADDEKRRLAEFKKFVDANTNKDEDMTSGGAEGDEDEEKDEQFDKFHRLISLNPEQILRYQRGGQPLPATEKAPPLGEPEKCQLCGGDREFEMQLTPHLLSLLEVDLVGQSIDWASLYIYTCKNSCRIPEDGYAREVVVKRDFAS